MSLDEYALVASVQGVICLELQFHKTNIPCLKQVCRAVQNQEQTQEVKLPDALPDVGRVLGAWGQPLLRGKQWQTGGMTISAGVMVWVLYAPEDGSEARCVQSWIPFQMNWDFPDTERDGVMQAQCLMKEVDARFVSARKILVRAELSVLGEAMEEAEMPLYAPGDIPEDVQLLRRSYPVLLPREAGEKAFALDEELSLPASQPGMEKLIRFQMRPELIDQKVMSGKVVFRGEANLHILYRTPEGTLKTWDFSLPFSQYADLNRDYDQEARAQVALAVTNLELEQWEDRLRLKAGLVGQYQIREQTVLEVVQDAFSNRRAVDLQVQEVEFPAILEQRRELLRAEGTVHEDGVTFVDTSLLLEQPRVRRNVETVELVVPGVLQGYSYDQNGAPRWDNVRWEGKLELPVGTECQLCVQAIPTGAVQPIGNDMQADIALEITTMAQQGLPMVAALELGDAREPDPARPSLILRRAGENGLWDMAKSCGSTVESIRHANGLEGEPVQGQLLLIPVS